MKKIFLILFTLPAILILNGCLAKQVNAPKYYELGLDIAPKPCANTNKTSVKIRSISATSSLDSRDIWMKSGDLGLYSLQGARFTSFVPEMFENALIKALSTDCAINLSKNAPNNLQIKLLELYADNKFAHISAIAWLNERGILLKQEKPLKSSSNDDIINAMNAASQELITQIIALIKE